MRRTSNHRIVLSAEDRTRAAYNSLRKNNQQLRQELRNTEQGMRNAFDPRVVASFVGAIGLQSLISQTTMLGDQYTKINERLSLGIKTSDGVAASESRLLEVRTQLLEISNRTFSGIDSNSAAFNKLSFATERLGKGSEETLKILETVNQTLQINSATTQEAISTRLQFAQALSADVLGGDELRALREAAPRLLKAIADGLDVPIGALKALGAEGALTANVVLKALETQTAQINEEFQGLSVTVDRAQQIWTNNLTEYVGAANEATGFNRLLADSIVAASENINTLEIGLGLVSAIFSGKLIGSLNGYLAKQIQLSASNKALAISEADAAKASLAKSSAILTAARSEQAGAAASLKAITATTQSTRTVHIYTAAKARLTAANSALIASEASYAAAVSASAVATGRASLAARGLGGAMTLLGGPTGVFLIAAAALFSYRKEILGAITDSQELEDAQDDHFEALQKVKKLTEESTTASKDRSKAIREEANAEIRLAKTQLARAQNELRESEFDDSNFRDSPGPGNNGARLNTVGNLDELRAIVKQRQDTLRELEKNTEQIQQNLNLSNSNRSRADRANAGAEEAANLRQRTIELQKQADQIKEGINPQARFNEKIQELTLTRLEKKFTATTKQQKEKVDQQQREADALLASADPQEKYNQQLDRANKLKEAGKLTEIEYLVVVKKFRDELAEATKVKEKETTEEERRLEQLKEQAIELNRANDPLIEYNARKKELNELNATGVLSEKAFNEEIKKAQDAYDLSNKFLQKQIELRRESASIGNNPIEQFRDELGQTGDFSDDEIDTLVGQKQANLFKEVKEQIKAQGQEFELTEEKLLRFKLSLDGLTPSQVQFAAGLIESRQELEKSTTQMGQFADSFESDLENSLKSGSLSFKNFADTVIDEILRMFVYKPLLDSLFGERTASGGRTGGGAIGNILASFFADGGIMLYLVRDG